MKVMTNPRSVTTESSPMSLPTLAEAITQEHLACLESTGTAAEHAWQAGRLLLEAKRQVSHGKWAAWLKDHTRLNIRTAQVYMKLAKAQRAAPERVSIRSVLRGLAAVDVPAVPTSEQTPEPDYTDSGEGYQLNGDPTKVTDKRVLARAIQIVEAGTRALDRKNHAFLTKIAAEWLVSLINSGQPRDAGSFAVPENASP